MKSRIVLLFSGFLLLWGILLARGAMLQVFPDSRLESLKRRQFETSLQIRTRRGAIVDRNGTELAASIPAYSLFADPAMVKNPYDLSYKLAKYLNIPHPQLRKRLRASQRRFLWVKRQISEKQKEEIERWNEPGLGFIEEPKRVYPNGSLMAQVLGFVGSDGNGLEGLELQYEKYLQGQLKRVILPRDAHGRPLLIDGRSLTEVPDGADLQLTIDHEVQFTFERALRDAIERFHAESAVGVVMDVQTSEVLAMATLPTLDLNEPSRHSLEIRRNRVVTDGFEPGSTMKTFLVAAALRESLVKPSTRFFCEFGKFKVGDKWITEAESREKYQYLTVSEILAFSSNVGSTKIALALGDERLRRTLTDFGFGLKTGVELPGEARGILSGLPWRPHLLSNISFGHGLTATPIQMATAYAAIANGGILRKPILVKAIRTPNEVAPLVSVDEGRRVLSTHDAATLRLMLNAATGEKATGHLAQIPGYHVAGKTGTAQKVDAKKGGYLQDIYISSFAGFVPAHNPRYVIYVAIDSPQKNSYYGSQVAAPVFAHMAQYLVRRAGLPPVMITESNVIRSGEERRRTELQAQALNELKNPPTPSEDEKGFPNLMGLTLREALHKIRGQTGSVKVRGHGVVVRTQPAAGRDFGAKQPVTLVLENPDR